jgi:hypothetical protein
VKVKLLRAKRDLQSTQAHELEMETRGYRRVEVHWPFHRGGDENRRIEDIQIHQDGQHVWIKVSPETPERVTRI